jgi:hypothetical protein
MKKIYAAIYIAAAFARLALPASTPGFATIYTLSGATPLGLSYSGGLLYGAAYAAMNSDECGFAFELQPPSAPGGNWAETVLYAFGPFPDACTPVGAPVAAANGALYGVTFGGGTYNFGTAYELQPPAVPGGSWSETVLYSFTDTIGPGDGPPTSLILGPAGQIYVTTSYSVIELQPPASPEGAWTPALLYSFSGGASGSVPTSLTAGPKGRFYGATKYGGGGSVHDNGAGTIFELFPPATQGGAWSHKVLLSFDGKNGAVPNAVTRASDGSLYGSTKLGKVYQLTPPSSPGQAWTQTILADFGFGYHCGGDSPVIVRNGSVYGSSCLPGGGVVFELQPPSAPGGPWTNTPLYTFTNGQIPTGSMVMTEDGTLYGVTSNPSGGTPGGTIYQITTQ